MSELKADFPAYLDSLIVAIAAALNKRRLVTPRARKWHVSSMRDLVAREEQV